MVASNDQHTGVWTGCAVFQAETQSTLDMGVTHLSHHTQHTGCILSLRSPSHEEPHLMVCLRFLVTAHSTRHIVHLLVDWLCFPTLMSVPHRVWGLTLTGTSQDVVETPRPPIHHGSRQLVMIKIKTALNQPKAINNRETISCVQENIPNYLVFPHHPERRASGRSLTRCSDLPLGG